MNLNYVQQMGILKAIQKAVNTRLDEVREAAEDELIELNEKHGCDRVQIKIGDSEIGCFSITFSKENYEVVDVDAFEDFCLTNGLARISRTIKPEYMVTAIDILERELPDALDEKVEISKDAQKLFESDGDTITIQGTSEAVPGILPVPKTIKGTRLTGCDVKTVVPALNKANIQVSSLLLGEKNE